MAPTTPRSPLFSLRRQSARSRLRRYRSVEFPCSPLFRQTSASARSSADSSFTSSSRTHHAPFGKLLEINTTRSQSSRDFLRRRLRTERGVQCVKFGWRIEASARFRTPGSRRRVQSFTHNSENSFGQRKPRKVQRKSRLEVARCLPNLGTPCRQEVLSSVCD